MEAFYNSIKSKCSLPVANIAYIVLSDNHYQFFAVSVSFREVDKNSTLKTLEDISKTENFFAFCASEKGKEFIVKNKEAISKGLFKSFFGFEGLGYNKVCKN